jgi:glycosyltransferase involved in cell wall biosynthesis
MTVRTLSVLMPNYNHSRYLAEAITGIATQSRPPDEFLILDDASTDNSLEVIAPFLNQFPFIRLIRHEHNQGVIVACQRLFAEARGDYVFSGAADDIRLPGFFQSTFELIEEFPQAGLVFGIVGMIDDQGRRLMTGSASRWHDALYADPPRFLREYLAVERPSHSACAGTIYRRDAIQEVGGFRADLGSWADTFAFRAIGLKYGVCYLPQEVVQARILAGSFSHQSSIQPWKMLDLISRAEAVMRSAEFRDRFPSDHVRQWRRDFRWQVIRDYFLGPEVPNAPRPSFLRRNLRRLPRLMSTISMFFYRGDACYDGTHRD